MRTRTLLVISRHTSINAAWCEVLGFYENGIPKAMMVVVVLPDPFRGMGAWRTPRRPNSRATPQGLDQRSKMEEVVPKMARRTAPTSRRLNVVVRSPPLYPRGGPKWRDNYHEGPDHPVAPNRLET